ncbi:hypothetical protein [Spartinivicinus ruber]|uniref:hypothetical protein n=1 Tax=Spartinivicinus ruber TaxID=2683272 RepID=UPI0013D3A326|nr:hypothetical protein [Spartinivicinus ruber]
MMELNINAVDSRERQVNTWGENAQQGEIGNIFTYQNPFNKKKELFKLTGLSDDKKYWYFLTIGW